MIPWTPEDEAVNYIYPSLMVAVGVFGRLVFNMTLLDRTCRSERYATALAAESSSS